MKTNMQIVEEFVALHKINNILDWEPVGVDSQDKLLRMYDRLMMGDYGDVRDNGTYNDSGEIVEPPTEFEIEISAHDSKTGNPVIFEWEKQVQWKSVFSR